MGTQKALLKLRKVDNNVRVEGFGGKLLATVNKFETTFLMPITGAELARINQLVQDFDFFIENLTEE